MESEEYEQIPWASLVAEQDDGIDRRIYIAAAAIGLLVVVVLGMRLLGGGSQPIPPQIDAVEAPPTPVAEAPVIEAPPSSTVITEADLMAELPVGPLPSDRLSEVTAEWFVIDWFTRDGSEETVRSIRAALDGSSSVDALPHEQEGEPVTFVEWAKAVNSEVVGDALEITVAYRAIRETDDGFVRDPVGTVTVAVARNGDAVSVIGVPREGL